MAAVAWSRRLRVWASHQARGVAGTRRISVASVASRRVSQTACQSDSVSPISAAPLPVCYNPILLTARGSGEIGENPERPGLPGNLHPGVTGSLPGGWAHADLPAPTRNCLVVWRVAPSTEPRQ